MSSADKLPSGKWRIRVSTGVKNDKGKYIYKTFTADTKREAELMASRYKVGNHNPNAKTIGGALDKYIQMRKPVLSPATTSSYDTIYRMLRDNYPEIFTISCDNLTAEIFQTFINELASKRSPKTVANYHGLISAVMKTQGLTVPNVALPQREKNEMEIPSSEEVKMMLQYAKGTEMEIPIMLAAFGPLRRGEIVALRLSDLDGNIFHVQRAVVLDMDREVIVKVPKTSAGNRYLRFSDKVIDTIKERGYITKLDLPGITRNFRKLNKDIGLFQYKFHSLRHYCASMLSNMGIPESEILRRGGWESAEIMKSIYRHAMQEVSVKADEKANRAFDELL